MGVRLKKLNKAKELSFLIMVVLFWFAQYVYIPFQTTYLTSFNITSNFVGAIIGAYGISQLVFRLPVGVLADKIGIHKPFIIIGCFASGGASLVRIFLPSGNGFLFGNLLSGFASAMWISFMVFYTQSFIKEEQQAATCRIVLFNNAGILIGFITSTLIYELVGMRVICILSFLSGMVAGILGLQIKEEKTDFPRVPLKSLLKVCRGKRILVFSLIALIQQGIQLTTTMSFTSTILKELGATSISVGVASIIYMISSVCFSGFASTKCCRKKGPNFWIPIVLISVTIYCILVPRLSAIPLILLLQILPGLSTGILFSYATSEAMKEVPQNKKSTAMGFYQAFYALGMTFFPILTGEMVERYDMQTGYLMLALIAVLGCILSIIYYILAGRFSMQDNRQKNCIPHE
ncbi:MAG: MFS transporter [Candidatus Galacturonibacter soehngenii]|uniref:MFS transporter n=1 Tax=Candidatus Galacturonatibacter soehngenii TaxID=2307010 RepID=A0A7V7QNE6_9FIRM|nr:MFS transporter [Candidatus Galacturonibacter soehngenii]MBA4687795.1 MFS transporter [Candidatus Galacturonibacter soehngenii]